MIDQQTIPNTKPIYCNYCRVYTNHVLRATHTRLILHEPMEIDFEYRVEHFLWACAGCETGLLEIQFISENLKTKTSKVETSWFAPERQLDELGTKYFIKLPEKLKELYREVIKAFNGKLYILSAAGLRALIEGICADKGVAGQTLEKKINNMVSLLPQNIVSSLHGFRFIGNTALHELNPPSRDDLRLAIEVSEDLLNFLYELDYKASRLPGFGR